MLRAADFATRLGLDVDEADVADALEVRPHGVGVEPQRVGDVGGRERSRRPAPTRGRSHTACCRRAPSGRRDAPCRHGGIGDGSTTRRDYTAGAGKIRPMGQRSMDSGPATTGAVAPPSRDDVLAVLGSVIDPELGADIVSLGMVPSVDVDPDGAVTVGVKLTIGGCPLRAQIKNDVETRVGVHPGVTRCAHRVGRDDQRRAHRRDAQGALERPRERARHRDPAVVAHPGHRQRQGRRRQVLGHRQPGRGARARRASPSACSTPTSGVSRCLACSASTSGSRRDAVEGRTSRDHPQRTPGRHAAMLKVVSHRLPRRARTPR